MEKSKKSEKSNSVENNPHLTLPLPDLHAEYQKIIGQTCERSDNEDTQSVLYREETAKESEPEVVDVPAPQIMQAQVQVLFEAKPQKTNGKTCSVAALVLVAGGVAYFLSEPSSVHEATAKFEDSLCYDVIDSCSADSTPYLPERKSESVSVALAEPLRLSSLHPSPNNSLDRANQLMSIGRQALKDRDGKKAVRLFVDAKRLLKENPDRDRVGALLQNVNRLLANALYLQGFFELEAKNHCKAKAYFLAAQDTLPDDQKVIERLHELSNLASC